MLHRVVCRLWLILLNNFEHAYLKTRRTQCDVPRTSQIASCEPYCGAFLLFLSLFPIHRTFPQMLLQSAINELDSYSLSSGRKVEYIAQISACIGFLRSEKSFWWSWYVVCRLLECQECSTKESGSNWTSEVASGLNCAPPMNRYCLYSLTVW